MAATVTVCPPRARPPSHRLTRVRDALAALSLAVVVLVSAAVSLVWVFLVPIYQAPDEPQHLDYALSIAHHGGLIRPDMTPVPVIPDDLSVDATGYAWLSTEAGMLLFRPARPWNYLVHQATHHLIAITEAGRVARNPRIKMAPEYGTLPFYAAVDAGAPAAEAVHLALPPSLVAYYPFGYYALLATWIELLRAVEDSLLFIFFGARALSAALLGCSLACMYGTLRELAFSRRFSLILVATIGLFPLTSFVSSYVQPDNLALMLVSLCLYLALLARRHPTSGRALGALGVAAGLLSLTKLHFYLAVAVPILTMLLGEMLRTRWSGRDRMRAVTLVLAPSVLCYSVHLWSVWAVQNRYFAPMAYGSDPATHILQAGVRALRDYYAGATHVTFWSLFGWGDTWLIIVDLRTTAWVRRVVQAATWLVVALMAIRLARVSRRLLLVAKRGRPGAAIRLAASNPVINSYLLFTILMVIIYVDRDGRFVPQGRNWLPFILPIFLTATVYAPKALPRRLRRSGSTAMLTGLALYSLLGAAYAPASIADRYYGQPTAAALQSIVGNLVRHLGG